MACLPAVRVLAALAIFLAAPSVRAGNAPPTPPCTLPDANDWREYTTAHFVLATDVPRKRVPALVKQLEEVHAIVVAALFGQVVQIPGRVHAVAFSSPRRYEELAPARRPGYGFSADGERWIVFPYDGREPGAAFAHELTHAISWHQFPRQPLWFREGLAQFMETVGETRNADPRAELYASMLVRYDRHREGRWAGFATPELAQRVRSSAPVSAKELLEGRGGIDESAPGPFHAASWVLYHWLSNEREKQLSTYEDRLAKGDDPAAAWSAAFPELDPAKPDAMARLDKELGAYRRDARYLPFRVRPGKVDTSFQERALPPAELHLMRVAIRHPSRWPAAEPARRALLRAEHDEALREDPLLPAAVAACARDEGRSVAAALSPLTVVRPADARGWFLLAEALDAAVDPQEKESSLRRAVALAPDDARMNAALARLLASQGRAREARSFAEHAIDLAPWDPSFVETLGDVAFAFDQCKPALDLQRRAAELLPAGDPAGDAVRARVAAYEATCTAATAAK